MMTSVEFVMEITPLVEVVQMLQPVTTIPQQLLTMVHVHKMICVEYVGEMILLAVDVRMKMLKTMTLQRCMMMVPVLGETVLVLVFLTRLFLLIH
jgi:hypothetical protein